MSHDREGVEHVIDGDDLYSLFVLPEGDHWIWQVTHVNTAHGQASYFAEPLCPPGRARTISAAWEAAEQFLDQHRKGPGQRGIEHSKEYMAGRYRIVERIEKTPTGYHWRVTAYDDEFPKEVPWTMSGPAIRWNGDDVVSTVEEARRSVDVALAFMNRSIAIDLP